MKKTFLIFRGRKNAGFFIGAFVFLLLMVLVFSGHDDAVPVIAHGIGTGAGDGIFDLVENLI